MMTYFEFMYNDRRCMVEMYKTVERLCVATFQVDAETVLQHEFSLLDIDLENVGYMVDVFGDTIRYEYNPYESGFEYCQQEVIEYLYNAKFELVFL